MNKVDPRPVSALEFRANEYVVYPAHGVGRIVRVEVQEIAGTRLELYVISFEKDLMTLRVPITKAKSVGLRRLSDSSLIERALKTLNGKAKVKRAMWSRRAHEYEQKINSGNLISIAEVVRDLYRNKDQPEQSYSERQLFAAAAGRLVREVAAARGTTEEDVVTYIRAQTKKKLVLPREVTREHIIPTRQSPFDPSKHEAKKPTPVQSLEEDRVTRGDFKGTPSTGTPVTSRHPSFSAPAPQPASKPAKEPRTEIITHAPGLEQAAAAADRRALRRGEEPSRVGMSRQTKPVPETEKRQAPTSQRATLSHEKTEALRVQLTEQEQQLKETEDLRQLLATTGQESTQLKSRLADAERYAVAAKAAQREAEAKCAAAGHKLAGLSALERRVSTLEAELVSVRAVIERLSFNATFDTPASSAEAIALQSGGADPASSNKAALREAEDRIAAKKKLKKPKYVKWWEKN